MHPWRTVVALGDSFTEGVGEAAEGLLLQGSLDLMAKAMRRTEPTLTYTNLAKRGLTTQEVREQQLGTALALSPDFASVIAGANDALKGLWQPERYEREMRTMITSLKRAGATLFMSTWPNWTTRLTLPKGQRIRLEAQLEEGNVITTQLAREVDAILLDTWKLTINGDPTYWSRDRIHPNARGYLAFAREAIQAIEQKTGYELGEPV